MYFNESPTYGREKVGQQARTYIQQLCEDTRCSSVDQPEAMNDRVVAREGQGYPCLAARHDDDDDDDIHILSCGRSLRGER